MLVDEGFEDGSELLLLATGKLRSGLEKASHLACRTRPSFPSSIDVVLTAEQFNHRDIESAAVLIVARSGAGKSALQDALCAFVPPEEAVRVTRLTGQALFYKDPYSLQRKVLLIAEDEGAAQAVYSLRTLASDQRLSIAADEIKKKRKP